MAGKTKNKVLWPEWYFLIFINNSILLFNICVKFMNALVAQLDRASDFGSGG